MAEEKMGTMTERDWFDLLERGLTTIAESKGITDDELESVYAIALDFYKTGRYADAETLFRFLTVYSHTEKKFWMGLGAVYQVQRKFDEALKVYSQITMLLDTKWVKPSYYAAECLLAKGDKANAKSALAHVRKFADKTTEEGRKFLGMAEELAKRIEDRG